MIKTTVLLSIAGAGLLALGFSPVHFGSTDYAAHPCPTEDSVSCYWDAATMGNGIGRSFTVDANGVISYWDGKP
jgi:hypothetical protein